MTSHRERATEVRQSLRTKFCIWRAARVLLLASLMFSSMTSSAATYVYDSSGKLVAVSDDVGASARYIYDSIGNLLTVDRFAAGQLAIFTFSPGRGAPGTTVKIKGQGFSAAATQNAVKFNGVVATTVAATVNEITATVPTGATTGPISVAVGTAVAASPVNFVVDAAAAVPTITSVAPTLVAVGEQVAISGKQFLPVVGQTSTLLNGRAVATSILSNTQIVFPVPAKVGSGKVTIITSYGSATSSQDVVVAPTEVETANIESAKRLTLNAAAQTFAVNTTGKAVAVLYDATVGDFPSLQFSGLGTLTVEYVAYSPTNVSIASGSVSAGSPTIHLPRVSVGGTYLLLVRPSSAPSSWKLGVEKAPLLAVNDSVLSQALSATAQSKRIMFTATAGQNLGLALSDLVTPNTTSYASLTVYKSDGSTTASQFCYAYNTGCQTNLVNLEAGTYSVVITPPYDGDRTMSFKSTLSTDVTGTLAADKVQTLTLGRRGQNGRLSFAGTAGQTVALQVAAQSTVPADRLTYYTVYKPDGAVLNSAYAGSNEISATTLNLPNLPVTGTYTVFVDPYYGETLSTQLTLATGVTGGPVINGASGSFVTRIPQQNVYLTFTATAGQNLGLALSDLVTPNATSYASLTVYKSDGSTTASQFCYAYNTGCQTNLVNLEAGTYSVVITPPYDGDRTMSFKSTLSTDVTGTLAADKVQTLTLGRRGQNGRLSFAGTAGQTVALQVAAQSTVPADRLTYYTVYKPDGAVLNSAYAGSNEISATTLNLPNLPVTGTYTVFVDPYYGETLSTQLTLATGVTGGPVINGASGSFVTRVPQQNVYLTFTVTAGQNLGLALSDLVTPNATSYASLTVYKSDGSTTASQFCYAYNTGCQTNLVNLEAGTYSVVITPPYDGDRTMSFKSTLSTDVTGTLAADKVQTLTLGRRGQNGRLSFAGTAGQTVALQVAAQSTVPADRLTYYTVYKPDGAVLNSAYAGSNGISATTLNLPNLPVTGTYTVFVDPYYGETLSTQLTLATGVTGGPVINGASGSFVTRIPQQNVYLTFTATAGQDLGLALSDLVTPNTTSYASLTVYKSDGSTTASQFCYAYNTGCQTNLVNLEAGTYSVVITPPYDGDRTMSFKSSLSTDVTGTLAADKVQTLTLGRRGQNGRLSFAGTAGQTVALQVAAQSTVPADRLTYYTVYKPDGAVLNSAYAGSNGISATTLNLPNLPMTGTYTVFVDPYYGETLSTQLTLATGVTGGPVINGASGSFVTRIPQQNVYLTFTATAGQNLGLALSDLVTPNATSYASLTVYKSDGSTTASQFCYAYNTGCQTNLVNLEAGTYSVVITPPYDGDRTMSFKSSLSTDVTGTLAADKVQTLTLGRRGQNGRLSFAGTAGQTVALQVAAQSTVPADRLTYYTVYKPDGAVLNSAYAGSNGISATTLNLPNLPMTGTYTVFVDPYYGETLSTQLTITSSK
uniref:beta strand repeat-containing protein n=2 Tax=Xanthomonas oryzae TaxID=347 RepID=UPI003DA05316